jgi:hypothetical protein
MPISKGKKRGRKPKGSIINYKNIEKESNVNTEEEPIIAHIPLILDDDSEIETIEETSKLEKSESDSEFNSKSIFLKDEKKDDDLKFLSNCKKCWWCKSPFDTPEVNLPENYFKGKFQCSGIFCSYNCAMSYNIDLNDEKVWKRNSLLNLLYRETYKSNEDEILPAPSWKILKDFGGDVSLKEFRENLKTNNLEYTYLHPPLINFNSSVQKSFKNKTDMTTSILNYSSEFILKRNKPLKSSRYSLENMMGLRLKKKKG